jgi:predicted nucleic acid-binding protein
MLVIVNTSPLIALERIGRLNLLKELFGSVVRPQSVLTELLAGKDRYQLSTELRDADWIVTEPDPVEMLYRKELGAGETAVLALAVKLKAELVVLDDLQARLVATSLGMALTGTLGVLVAAHRKGLLTDLRGAIHGLEECGFRVSPRVVAGLMSIP